MYSICMLGMQDVGSAQQRTVDCRAMLEVYEPSEEYDLFCEGDVLETACLDVPDRLGRGSLLLLRAAPRTRICPAAPSIAASDM